MQSKIEYLCVDHASFDIMLSLTPEGAFCCFFYKCQNIKQLCTCMPQARISNDTIMK